ncbi:MAG: endonuclease/exonuclease/phosphatase family protein [Frankiales bacterium]|nr:endonuclease/exonuclease/phosphatase family protein [Frankiales bacterium]
MKRLVTVLLAVLTALLAIPTLVRLYGDRGHVPLTLIVVALPFTVPPLVLILVAQLVLRRLRTAALTAVLLVLNAIWFVPLYVGDAAGKGQPLTVMTANLRYGGGDPFRIVSLVRSQHVDVLATEELTQSAVNNLQGAGLKAELPYFTGTPDPKDGPDGSGLYSRYPISPQSEWRLRFSAPGAVVQAPGGDVLVRVVHATSPVTGEKGVYRSDYNEILRDARALPTATPTIVLGDFNATLDNSLLRSLMGSRFRDAAEKAGSGLVRTWGRDPGTRPLLDLDHVFVDSLIGVRSTAVFAVPRSDHHAVVARLVVR